MKLRKISPEMYLAFNARLNKVSLKTKKNTLLRIERILNKFRKGPKKYIGLCRLIDEDYDKDFWVEHTIEFQLLAIIAPLYEGNPERLWWWNMKDSQKERNARLVTLRHAIILIDENIAAYEKTLDLLDSNTDTDTETHLNQLK